MSSLDERFTVVVSASGAKVIDLKTAGGAAAPPPAPKAAKTKAPAAAGSAPAKAAKTGDGSTPAAAAAAKGGKAGGKAAGGAGAAAPAKDSGKAAAGGAGAPSKSTAGDASDSKSFAKRDRLLAVEKEMQAVWAAEHLFEEDAPDANDGRGKFMVTFPYPYMNGRMHLGHAFTLTKADFSANFHRLLGERVLFPFAFHCTGMPIQAAANKLKRELEEAEIVDDDDAPAAAAAAAATAAAAAAATPAAKSAQAPGVFKGKKTKLVVKTGTSSQFDILVKSGVPEEEVPKFVVRGKVLVAVLSWCETGPIANVAFASAFARR